jgi:hypothetical protein
MLGTRQMKGACYEAEAERRTHSRGEKARMTG